jgi:hypothetical protein
MSLTDPININQHPINLLAEAMEKLNSLLQVEGIGVSVRITFQNVKMDRGIHETDVRVELLKTLDSDIDDDLNEPLGTPSCNLGEDCESCQ